MRQPEANAYEASLVAELRRRKDEVRSLLLRVKRELRVCPTGLCFATERAERRGESDLRRDLVRLYNARLAGCATLEEWLRQTGVPGAAHLVYPDPRLRSTRLAWVDSLIKELCE